MTRSFAANLKENPLTILCLHPGWVRTDMGGPDAPVDVATSAAGLANVIERYVGSKCHTFIDYEGAQLPW
jgi:hypothetical protein